MVLRLWHLCAVLAIFACGCRPLSALPSMHTAQRVPSISSSPEAISLDVAFVERPLGDRLLGSDLWNDVDQTAAIEDETREALSRSGFRLGISGSLPPPALQTLLGLTADFADVPQAEKEKKLVGRQAILRNGWSTEIQVGPSWETCRVPLYRPGSSEPVVRTLELVRCVYKVTATRVQDGWVRLDFLPQVHHGAPGPVIKPGNFQFEITHSQNVEEFPQLQFSVTLAMNEMAVITSDDPSNDNLARLFFIGPEEEPKSQRLLVVRLANMGLAESPYRDP